MATKKNAPTWSDVKAKLADFDRAGLMGLVQDLYAAGKDNQDVSVSKAKKAIVDYKKAVGQRQGLAELMVLYCERAASFSAEYGLQDESFLDPLVRMFEQALKTVATLPEDQRADLWARLDAARQVSHNIGYGVGENMDDLLAEYKVDV